MSSVRRHLMARAVAAMTVSAYISSVTIATIQPAAAQSRGSRSGVPYIGSIAGRGIPIPSVQPIMAGTGAVTWAAANALRRAEILRAANEVEPYLAVNSRGLLTLRAGARPLSSFSPEAQELVNDAFEHLNPEVANGNLVLLPDLSVVERSRGIRPAGTDYFHWRWFGYEAGLSEWRLDVLTDLLRIGAESEVFKVLVVYLGWGESVAWPATVYCFVYYVYINVVDMWGGYHGVKFTATWGNLWAPTVTPNR